MSRWKTEATLPHGWGFARTTGSVATESCAEARGVWVNRAATALRMAATTNKSNCSKRRLPDSASSSCPRYLAEVFGEELVLEEKGLRNYGTDPTRSEQPGHGGDQVTPLGRIRAKGVH
jgi:hypothetical protein